MYKILTLNQISVKGLEKFPRDKYEVASEIVHPDAILARSHKIGADDLPSPLLAVARAGAGVNTIAVDACSERGIPVFNTPGANANAVKELVLAALILASRGILDGAQYVQNLAGKTEDAHELHKMVEKEKKQFRGQEIKGKTLGVVGLGAIGSHVANMALSLGMDVLGFDPALSVEAAWRLSSKVQRMENLPSLLAKSDYVSLHVPFIEETKELINSKTLASCKPGTRLLNFSRSEIVQVSGILEALENGKLSKYLCDFPHPSLLGNKDVVIVPHIGASTNEAEENCAVMAADQLMDFLENGNIVNSVNFPTLYLERNGGYRIAMSNKNIPKVLNNILTALGEENINVIDMLNKSRGEVAYDLIDIDTEPTPELISRIESIEGVTKVRSL